MRQSPCFPKSRLRSSLAAGLLTLLWAGTTTWGAEGADAWTDRDTRLANQYLSLLASEPEYGRMVDLLWDLYDKHHATGLLLENVGSQAEATRQPAALLVHGHLLRKGHDLKRAATVYDQALAAEPTNLYALRSRADLAREMGDANRASQFLRRWIDLLPDSDPRKPQGWLELGTVALASNKPAQAAEYWQKAVKLRPQDLTLARQVAELLLRAGFADKAAEFYQSLTTQANPEDRLRAYFDLARLYEHADQLAKADTALTQGLALLDFRDRRYEEFFRRRVRLHERFGALEDLRHELLEQAEKKPPAEKALRDMVLFSEGTVDLDEHLRWLRALVQTAAGIDDYRWELVRALLDHEGADEAARLLDERMKGDGSDLPAIVFLRCEADLRKGQPAAAAERLKRVLETQGSLDVEKQVLMFAQSRALDPIIEIILNARVRRDPGKSESVFELAGFYRARKDMAAADAVLHAFTLKSANATESRKRLNDAAAFLAAGNDLGNAIAVAREAASLPTAGREECLRLADLLAEHGDSEEALALMEKAWQLSTTDEDRTDADERRFSLLMGGENAAARNGSGIGADFRLPDAFTGKGFASDEPAGNSPKAPRRVIEEAQKMLRRVAEPAAGLTKSSPKDAGARQDFAPSPAASPAEVFRASWWAVRAELFGEAYALLDQLAIDPVTGRSRELSLEAEKLLLELAFADENKGLAIRTLKHLRERDSANEVRYVLRTSELLMETEQAAVTALQSNAWKRDGPPPPPAGTATQYLERAFQRNPDSEALLSALTIAYGLQGRRADSLALWKGAVERAPAGTATALRERYAELLLRQQKVPEYVVTEIETLESESDVKKRREVFNRFLDRLLWSEQGGELNPEVKSQRLDLVEKALTDRLQRHPFDAFYPEAQALVYERKGDAQKAFASMKQAYYTAPETPFSLGQLRDAALKVSDLKSAIYFQKQIAAGAPPAELASESRRLVELLEQTFQIAEADRVRRRLESRFSQNADALEDLADHYKITGQDEAERRVYEQVAKVRPWDARSQLRIALKCLRLADDEAAEKYLREILDKTEKPGAVTATEGMHQRVPLPLSDERKSGAVGPVSEVTALLDTAAGLERDELGRLRGFLNLPRPEFAELPETVALVRLRTIEELSRLLQEHGGASFAAWQRRWTANAKAEPVEKLWAFYYSGMGQAFRSSLQSLLGEKEDLESQFCLVWLLVKSQGMRDALSWTSPADLDFLAAEKRKRLLLASASMLADLDSFRYDSGQLTALGSSRLLRDPPLRDITRRLQDQQRYDEALELGESLRRHAYSPLDDFFLGRIAESAERWDLARHYLSEVVRTPYYPGSFRGAYDPYLVSLSTSTRLAKSAQEREETLRQAWRQLQSSPSSPLTTLHRTAVIGVAGASKPAARELMELITGDLVAARSVGETRGSLMPQGTPGSDEPLHASSLWAETRELQAGFVQQGLSPVVDAVNAQLDGRWGNISLSSRSGQQFGEWRLSQLLRQLRLSDYPTRLRMIREYLGSVDLRAEVSVDTLGELGSRLETAGMSREAIEVYQMLPGRAPANPDYAQWLLRACETALDTEMGVRFSLQLLLAEPPMKPPQPGDEVLREKHAHFLALDFNLDELHRLGFEPAPARVLQGRIPHEVPYLRELALLQERLGQDGLAREAWQRMHDAFAANAEAGLQPDEESCLHLGRLLRKQGKTQSALDLLRLVPMTEQSGSLGHEALLLRAELASELGAWKEFQELMPVAVERKSLEVIAQLADLLRKAGRDTEALNFLTQAERSLKEDSGRFRLRLELLKLIAADPSWTPVQGRSQIAALFRSRNRDRETLQRMVGWMRQQAKGPNDAAWRSMLRAEARAGTDRPAATLALCAFAKTTPDAAADDLIQGWRAAREGDRICVELGAQTLLEEGRPQWSWQACQVLSDLPSLRLDGQKLPLMVNVAHALGERTVVRELFAETLRMPFPGGNRPLEWIQAFANAGEDQLARELFTATLDRLESTETPHPELFAAWVRFLIRHQQFEAAEAFLMKQNWAMVGETAQLTFELYQAWGKLTGVESELPKFHLPGGILKEVLFLANQALGLPPPQPKPIP